MTLTLEITSDEVVKRLSAHAASHGRTVEEEALALLGSLPVTEDEYERRRQRAVIHAPKHSSWEALTQVIETFPEETLQAIETHVQESRKRPLS